MRGGQFQVLTHLFVTFNSVGPTGRLEDVIGKLPTDVALKEIDLLKRKLANKSFRYYEVLVPARRGRGFNQKMIREGSFRVAEETLATGYNVAPKVNVADPKNKPFRQRVGPAAKIIEADRQRMFSQFSAMSPRGGRTVITSRKQYLKIVDEEMGITRTGKIGQAVTKSAAFHLSRRV
jgi:hypothetical protein